MRKLNITHEFTWDIWVGINQFFYLINKTKKISFPYKYILPFIVLYNR
jgi:hypothetical protein